MNQINRSKLASLAPVRTSSNPKLRRSLASGFTLIEVLIAAAIVAILAAIALPSYQKQVLKTKRTAAKTALAEIAIQQEQFRGNRKRYAKTLTELGYAANTLYLDSDQNLSASSGGETIYSITLGGYSAGGSANCSSSGSATNSSYTLKAAPQGGQAKDSNCLTLCLAHTGERGSSAGDPKDCW